MAKRAFDDGRIFGVTHGTAPFRVLALPGWLHQASDFDTVLGGLRPGAGAVALDLPGFGGATPEPATALGSAGYAELVAPVLGELEPPVVLLGHSFGGRVAVHLAATHPGSVRALVLTGVPGLVRRTGPRAKAPLGFRVAKALHRVGLLSDAKMERQRRTHGSADYRNAPSPLMRDVLVKVTNEDYEDQLRAITCPVELVYGERDTAATPEMARRAADVLGAGRATLTVLAGVDHFTPTRAPEALRDAIARHLPPTP
ncbi:MAG TPA: alpha/beta hydrolase [Acidimicrobiales bacterium]|nr:alpha/beta hydrolase [Acidimicrobiales bacterium]